MFIVWRNIGHVTVPNVYVKRKHQIRMDCSKTTSGKHKCLIFPNALHFRSFYWSCFFGRNFYFNGSLLRLHNYGQKSHSGYGLWRYRHCTIFNRKLIFRSFLNYQNSRPVLDAFMLWFKCEIYAILAEVFVDHTVIM